MHNALVLLTLALVAGIGWIPLLIYVIKAPLMNSMTGVVVALNLIGWSLIVHFMLGRKELRRVLQNVARQIGMDTHFRNMDELLDMIVREVRRRHSSLSINLIERKISSKEELSRTLERIVALAYRLFSAQSAELALFDTESSLYHSAFVLGRPFRTSAQAMLSGAKEGVEEVPSVDVLVQPIAFAGSVLGSLRVALKKGEIPSRADREIMRVLALQSGLAIINSEYTAELMRMKRASEETVKAKTGFLANLSHEIRGPLGIMLNAVELVVDGLCGTVTQDQLDTLKMVRSNGEHLLELINDVLDYAKIESGKISPNRETILLNELLNDIAGVVRTQALRKNHTLICHDNEELLPICCDRRHIRQMLINLLTNAIKYTPDGGKIELWAERAPGARIKINVRDSGIGIDVTAREVVFAPFERVDNSYAINQIGAGLGMALTKRLAVVNGGQVDFVSSPGKGSHFWLTFPAASYERGTAVSTEPKPQEDPKGSGELILLVESDDGEREMVARYLRHIGFRVATAATQVEAMDVLRKGEVELAMVNNRMVDKPEDFLVKNIRDSAKSAMLPIILVSSRAFVFDIEKYLQSGIDLCLIKPLELKKLGHICRRLIDGDACLEISEKEIENAEPAKSSQPTASVKPEPPRHLPN
ncbi:MAG: response regulator [Deltaproteobacteria bacterium]|nr:response regulator [Deltaproteobacteria bacterium]